MKLIIDDRERAVIQYFEEAYKNIEIEVKRIQIGDYVVMHEEKIIFAIERKSWTDLASSIRDGRKENINKLKSLREQTGCKLFYLLEGKARHAPDKKFARMPYKNLQAHLDHLMMRDDIFMLHSNDERDTANRLIELMTNFLSFHITVAGAGAHTSLPPPADQPTTTTNELILKTVIKKTDLEIQYKMWSAIPGITDKTASLFIDAGYHISDLFLGKISRSEISVMKYNNGTIIGKRAERIIEATKDKPDNNKIYYNIMAEIPGVTKKTAAMILMKATFKELLIGDLSVLDICNIKKTEKTKVGDAVAQRIRQFLVQSSLREHSAHGASHRIATY